MESSLWTAGWAICYLSMLQSAPPAGTESALSLSLFVLLCMNLSAQASNWAHFLHSFLCGAGGVGGVSGRVGLWWHRPDPVSLISLYQKWKNDGGMIWISLFSLWSSWYSFSVGPLTSACVLMLVDLFLCFFGTYRCLFSMKCVFFILSYTGLLWRCQACLQWGWQHILCEYYKPCCHNLIVQSWSARY